MGKAFLNPVGSDCQLNSHSHQKRIMPSGHKKINKSFMVVFDLS